MISLTSLELISLCLLLHHLSMEVDVETFDFDRLTTLRPMMMSITLRMM